MDARELHIGDWVRIKSLGFEVRVVGIYCDLFWNGDPNTAELQLYFENNEGDVWECTSDQVEPIDPKPAKRKRKPSKHK